MIPDERIVKALKQHGIVTIHEAADATGINYVTILKRIVRGGLPAYKIGAGRGGIWLIRLSLLQK